MALEEPDVSVAEAAAGLIGTTPETQSPGRLTVEQAALLDDPTEALAAVREESKEELGVGDRAQKVKEAEEAAEKEALDRVDQALAKSAEGRSAKLQKLIDSKGGNEDQFAESIYEQYNSTSRLRKELDELKEQLVTGKVGAIEEDELAPIPAPLAHEVQRFDREITARETEITQNEHQMAQLSHEGQELRLEIASLKGEARRASEDYDKQVIENKIDRLEAKLERKGSQYREVQAANKALNREKQDLAHQKSQAEHAVSEQRVQQQLAEVSEHQLRVKTLSDFLSTVEEMAETLDLSNETKEHMAGTIRAEAAFYIRSLPQNSEAARNGIDIKAFVKARAIAYAKALGVSRNQAFAKVSQEKVLSGRTPAAERRAKDAPSAPQTKPAASKTWTADFARQRAQKILGG